MYRAGLRGELWTASREARLVLSRQLQAYNEAIDDGVNLQVSTINNRRGQMGTPRARCGGGGAR